jgi:hypothetical protein
MSRLLFLFPLRSPLSALRLHTSVVPSSTILVVGTPIRKLPSSMVRHCVYLKAWPLQCIFKCGIVPKVSVLGGMLATLDLSSKDLTYIGPTYFGVHLGCPSLGASPVRLHQPNLTHLGRTSKLPLNCLGCNSKMTFYCQVTPRSHGGDAKSRPTRFPLCSFGTWIHDSHSSTFASSSVALLWARAITLPLFGEGHV